MAVRSTGLAKDTRNVYLHGVRTDIQRGGNVRILLALCHLTGGLCFTRRQIIALCRGRVYFCSGVCSLTAGSIPGSEAVLILLSLFL